MREQAWRRVTGGSRAAEQVPRRGALRQEQSAVPWFSLTCSGTLQSALVHPARPWIQKLHATYNGLHRRTEAKTTVLHLQVTHEVTQQAEG